MIHISKYEHNDIIRDNRCAIPACLHESHKAGRGGEMVERFRELDNLKQQITTTNNQWRIQ
jgi:hypothetical protein